MNTIKLKLEKNEKEIDILAFVLSGHTHPYKRNDIVKLRDLHVEIRNTYQEMLKNL